MRPNVLVVFCMETSLFLIWVDVVVHAESGFVCSGLKLPDSKLGGVGISVFWVKKTLQRKHRLLDHGHVYIPERSSAPTVQEVAARSWLSWNCEDTMRTGACVSSRL